jgi:hypothetical protein
MVMFFMTLMLRGIFFHFYEDLHCWPFPQLV